jgi:hypothetical protein
MKPRHSAITISVCDWSKISYTSLQNKSCYCPHPELVYIYIYAIAKLKVNIQLKII